MGLDGGNSHALAGEAPGKVEISLQAERRQHFRPPVGLTIRPGGPDQLGFAGHGRRRLLGKPRQPVAGRSGQEWRKLVGINARSKADARPAGGYVHVAAPAERLLRERGLNPGERQRGRAPLPGAGDFAQA